MRTTPEGKVKKKVRELLNKLGAYYVMPVTSGYGNSGAPDFLVCLRGRFVGIECKANGGKPTPLQLKNFDAIEDAGGAWLLIDELNVDLLEPLLYQSISKPENRDGNQSKKKQVESRTDSEDAGEGSPVKRHRK